MSYKYEKEYIQYLLGKDIYELLKVSNAMLAGGAITSIFTRKEINDFDIYFRSKKDMVVFIDNVYNKAEDKGEDYPFVDMESRVLIHTGSTDKASMFSFKLPTSQDERKGYLQMIHYKTYESPDDIFKSFDFTINMVAFDFKTEQFVFDSRCMKHLASNLLVFNSETDYPIISMARVKKYMDRGYDVFPNTLVSIGLAIAQLNLNSWEDVRNQFSGLYGFDVSLFKGLGDFSQEKLQKVINTPSYKLTKINYKSLTHQQLIRIIEGRAKPKLLFKKVKSIGEGSYESIYRSSFKYNLNEVSNGGECGVWAYDSIKLAKNHKDWLSNRNKKVIILEPCEGSRVEFGEFDDYKIYGDFKVIGEVA